MPAYKHLKPSLLFASLIFLLGACGKHGANKNPEKNVTVYGGDVYLAGFNANGPDVAAYWKNGQLVSLPNGVAATGIAVSGTDVYVCGYDNNNNAVYWKNGVVHSLGLGRATGIALGE